MTMKAMKRQQIIATTMNIRRLHVPRGVWTLCWKRNAKMGVDVVGVVDWKVVYDATLEYRFNAQPRKAAAASLGSIPSTFVK